jgi:hypothetical protein
MVSVGVTAHAALVVVVDVVALGLVGESLLHAPDRTPAPAAAPSSPSAWRRVMSL